MRSLKIHLSILVFLLSLVSCKTNPVNDLEGSLKQCELVGEFAYLHALKKRPEKPKKDDPVSAKQDILVVATKTDDRYESLGQDTKLEVLKIIDETDVSMNFLTRAVIYRVYFETACEAEAKGKPIRPFNEIYQSDFFSCWDDGNVSESLTKCMREYVSSP
ncbi:hypothetical protein SHAM105786_17060 [Shewanella amazonensis]|uniref:Lipoprotein n=1 Tax=Shewanella amazonensis (strain ATCC BAA-1098 / SB2B) TaxID=326297 RepID=A1S596_SHEAM|nr:hypothetical protein [Shewanella amazonensis]ABL99552.1 hypothetical protein Sama_1345 [Shewanella amazonensis SB2B]